MSVIQVNGLSKHFGALKAVDQLDFSVTEGEVFGFLGQNGSGKSTTIRMLLSLIHPTSGSIELFGKPLNKYRDEILEEVGAIIERPDLYPYLTAKEHLQLFAKLRNKHVGENSIQDTLVKVGLADRSKDKVQTFSLGMKQRLGIAIALLHNPSLIILDEPTNGLDPQGIADIRNLILHLSRESNKTIIVSSHLLSEIEQIATRVLIIDKGKKLVEGNATELLDPAQTIVELQTLDNAFALQQLQLSNWTDKVQGQRNNTIVIKLDRKEIPALHTDLMNMQIQLLSLQPRHSLEDYFLQVTSGNQHVDTYTN